MKRKIDTEMNACKQAGMRLVVKKVVDRVCALLALLVLSPLLLAIAAVVRVSMGRPVFFRQQRPGRLERPFKLVKFRTMLKRFDGNGQPLPDETRITVVGKLLRGSSLDELPQLWNVLRGDMSLVGPRPLLMEYLPRYSPEQARRHDVMPGITGWAQINGRNALSWEEKFALDTWYVDHWSLWMDLKILGMTATRVLKREGVSNQGHATMPEFMGLSTSTDIRNESGDAYRR